MKINVIKCNENAIMPEYAHPTDSGFDLYTSEDFIINPKTTGAVPTGLKFEIPEGYGIMIRGRSGNTLNGVKANYVSGIKGFNELTNEKNKMDIKVEIGTIDEEYRGEIKILTTNHEFFSVCIPKGTKLAQGVIEKIPKAQFVEVKEITESKRGENGFGSTGC